MTGDTNGHTLIWHIPEGDESYFADATVSKNKHKDKQALKVCCALNLPTTRKQRPSLFHQWTCWKRLHTCISSIVIRPKLWRININTNYNCRMSREQLKSRQTRKTKHRIMRHTLQNVPFKVASGTYSSPWAILDQSKWTLPPPPPPPPAGPPLPPATDRDELSPSVSSWRKRRIVPPETS